MENQNTQDTNSSSSSDWQFGIILAGITGAILVIALIVLNYFNILALSQWFPSAFGWLPHRSTSQSVKAPKPANTSSDQPLTDYKTFDLKADPRSQRGTLVKNTLVLYTLQGKLIKITPTQDGKYNLEVNALDGSQNIVLNDVGGEGVLKGSVGPEIQWTSLKPGDDLQLNITVEINNKAVMGKPNVTQVIKTNR